MTASTEYVFNVTETMKVFMKLIVINHPQLCPYSFKNDILLMREKTLTIHFFYTAAVLMSILNTVKISSVNSE